MFVGPRMKRDLITVTPGATLEEAARLLTAHRIHHLPVVEEGNRLAGIVSDTDLRNATLDGMFGGADRGDSGRPVTVGEIMSRDLVTLSPGDTLDDAMLVLSRQRIGALPVVEGDRLVGIVTKADILSALLSTLDIEGIGVRIEVVLRSGREGSGPTGRRARRRGRGSAQPRPRSPRGGPVRRVRPGRDDRRGVGAGPSPGEGVHRRGAVGLLREG